jgi:mannose-6-phosphate isomerase-like protein (cupin superfamily)
VSAVAILLDLDDIRRNPSVARFEGAQHGDGIAVSFFAVSPPPGRGATPHVHPYAEVFLIEEGEATFTVGGEEIAVHVGVR